MRSRLVWFFMLLSTLSIIVGALAFSFWQWLTSPLPVSETHQVYIVEPGTGLHAVGRDMQQIGLVKWPKLWVLYARVEHLDAIKAGEFQFSSQESPLSLLQKLQRGEVVEHRLTLVEGRSFKQMLLVLNDAPKLSHKLESGDALAVLQASGVDLVHPEGWFFPDTYQYLRNDSDISILLRAHKKMKSVLNEEWDLRDSDLPYESVYEALIMASIVEKETGVASERKTIAGVFVRRLRKGMRLQTDPTVIYGMGDKYQGNITRKDLKKLTAYNTYMIKGLPPTPIAMPGREAIHAALHPEPGESLYFVAKGDGSHYFSATLDEHINAVRKYQKKRRADYRSSPQK
ncbi:MAG: BCR, YceG family protein [Alteromonadaceae bacterium]|nr:MAG: BCR, YceG family protein [Alteromonadaceae bacterium]